MWLECVASDWSIGNLWQLLSLCKLLMKTLWNHHQLDNTTTMPRPGRPADLSVSKHFTYYPLVGTAICYTAVCKLCGKHNGAKSIDRERKHLLQKCSKYKEWVASNNKKIQTKITEVRAKSKWNVAFLVPYSQTGCGPNLRTVGNNARKRLRDGGCHWTREEY